MRENFDKYVSRLRSVVDWSPHLRLLNRAMNTKRITAATSNLTTRISSPSRREIEEVKLKWGSKCKRILQTKIYVFFWMKSRFSEEGKTTNKFTHLEDGVFITWWISLFQFLFLRCPRNDALFLYFLLFSPPRFSLVAFVLKSCLLLISDESVDI